MTDSIRFPAAIALMVLAMVAQANDTIHFGFEDGTLNGFRVVEGSFEKLITDRTSFHHVTTRYNRVGKYHLSTLECKNNTPSDLFMGQIVSPVFILKKPVVTCLVGGGAHKNTYVAICLLSGQEVARANGTNAQPMKAVKWNLAKWVGKKLYIKIVDGNEEGWGHVTFDDFRATGTLVKGTLAKVKPILKVKKPLPESAQLKRLRAAVNTLIRDYPSYARLGRSHLATITRLKAEKNKAVVAKKSREILLANPLLTRAPIVFVTRKQYAPDHHNTETMFQTNEMNTRKFGPGGSYLKSIDFAKGGTVSTILDPGKTSVVRDPEVSWDGKTVLLSMRKSVTDNYHVYEINADGTGLKQLTNAKHVFDIDPLYLPDGDIAFTSSREPKYCMCNRHIMGNLYRMKPDGANIHQIGKSTLFEGHGSVLPDGRIIYYRWEYVDRNFGDAQGLWVVNPDGTNHAIYWGNNISSPGGVIDPRPIPGTDLVMCIFGSCHDRPWGAVAILDRRKGVDSPEAVVRTWPASAKKLVNDKRENAWDAFVRVRPKYEDPFPLDKNFFLVSRMTGKGEQMGIYLIDMFGNEELLHTEGHGCYDPKPLAARKKPRSMPTRRNFKRRDGHFYVQNAYIGTHMKGVKPGDIKYLRVVEAPEKRTWTNASWGGQGTIAPSMNWHDFSNKRILGTVPVEKDGSASFKAPSDTFLFFQVLDKDKKMIHSMRSGTQIQSGEFQGCVGCHEDRVKATPELTRQKPLALKRSPSVLNGWYGKPRLFSYAREVQPVFDKHCVKCHDFDKPAGKKLILAGDKNVFFNASYTELWRKKIIKCVGGGPARIQKADSWGSHKSKLIQVLEKGHNKVKLSDEEMARIVTWVDMNGVYYPTYDSAYPKSSTGRSPLNGGQLKRLSQLTKVAFVGNHRKNQGPLVSFDRPEISPCLKALKKGSKEYNEALAIIKAGQAALAKSPRADMPNFKPAEYAQKRLKFYDDRRKHEIGIRKAMDTGKKVYDPGVK